MKSDYLVLFSGGTGGHVIPAVNYGNFLIDCNYNGIPMSIVKDRFGVSEQACYSKLSHLKKGGFQWLDNVYILF